MRAWVRCDPGQQHRNQVGAYFLLGDGSWLLLRFDGRAELFPPGTLFDLEELESTWEEL